MGGKSDFQILQVTNNNDMVSDELGSCDGSEGMTIEFKRKFGSGRRGGTHQVENIQWNPSKYPN